MPTVTELHLLAVDLPFKVTVRHAAAARTTSESLFLRARLDDGTEGWGECLPRAYVSGEHCGGAAVSYASRPGYAIVSQYLKRLY